MERPTNRLSSFDRFSCYKRARYSAFADMLVSAGHNVRSKRQRIKIVRDQRGTLRIFEKDASLSFPLKRCFVISGVPRGKTRGEHSIPCNLFLATLIGKCRLTVRQGNREQTFELFRQSEGVSVPKGAWVRLDRFSANAIVLVCASARYKRRR